MKNRDISQITRNPWQDGFLGTGHRAKAVLDGVPLDYADPFVAFMDDRLDLPGGEPVGGAHPHAGFETLTLVIKGNGKNWETGSFELMTAGNGIIHTEEISEPEQLHILQVWLALSPEKRYVQPRLQRILLEDVPKIRTDNFELRVYSGSSNGLTSPIDNHTPLTVVEYRAGRGTGISQEVPAGHRGLVYVLKGRVQAGTRVIEEGEAGWLEHYDGDSVLLQTVLDEDTHWVLYAGEPHHAPVVQHGPFVADSLGDISEMYRRFRRGNYPHVYDLPASQVIEYHTEFSA